MEDLLGLAAKDLSQGYRVIVRARGNSMYPLIHDKTDKIVLAPICARLKVGEIVLAINDGDFILHRIVKIYSDSVLLRGDGNPAGIEHIKIDSILGEAIAIVRSNGRVIHKGSLLWRGFQYLWPKGGWFRKKSLGILRRLDLM